MVARNPAYVAYTGLATTSYAGLFAWISASSFVLQNIYGLSPFNFGVTFALGSLGYMIGATVAARVVVPLGIDGTIGIGCVAMALGGFGMVAAVALALSSAYLLVLPMAVYLAGMGMVLPQSIAGAMTPFPERAGAASALLGFIQQAVAALVRRSGRAIARTRPLGRLSSRWPSWAAPACCCGSPPARCAPASARNKLSVVRTDC